MPNTSWLPSITRFDIWAVIIIVAIVILAIKACRFRLPDPAVLQAYAALTNTKGGLIILLVIMWYTTIGATIGICLWAIIYGINPQNGILLLLLSVLTSGAWGNVNGALFKTMTGEEPKPTLIAQSTAQSTTTTSTSGTTSSSGAPVIPAESSLTPKVP